MTEEEQDFLDMGLEEVKWIRLARDREQWPAVLKAVMNLRFP